MIKTLEILTEYCILYQTNTRVALLRVFEIGLWTIVLNITFDLQYANQALTILFDMPLPSLYRPFFLILDKVKPQVIIYKETCHDQSFNKQALIGDNFVIRHAG